MDDDEVLIDRLERRLQERQRMRDLESKVHAHAQDLAELRHALDAMVTGVLQGICPKTAQRPQIVSSLASLRNVSGMARVGQLFDVLVGGSNGRELHEVSAVNASGQIMNTKVIDGSAVFVVPQVHSVRSD